jgi:hypothetical protein
MFHRRLLGFAAVIAGLLALLILSPAGSMLRGLVSGSGETTAGHQDRHAGSHGAKPPPSKTDRRPIRPRPTIEETTALLENTIIPEADFGDLTLSERISSLDKLIEAAGVDRRDLRVVLSPRIAQHPMGSEAPWGGGKRSNISAATILRSMTSGKSPLQYRVGEGTVEVGLKGNPGDRSQSETNISLINALDEITRRTGLQWKIDDFAITISPADTLNGAPNLPTPIENP